MSCLGDSIATHRPIRGPGHNLRQGPARSGRDWIPVVDRWGQKLMASPTIREISAQTGRLRAAQAGQDSAALARCYAELAARNPLLEGRTAATEPARLAFRENIEAWDDALQDWILAPGADDRLLESLTVAGRGEFRFRHLQLMAVWLSAVGSDREPESGLLEKLEEANPAEQAVLLARFCCRATANTPAHYEAVHKLLHGSLRPFWAFWGLGPYLIAPLFNVSEHIADQRLDLCREFGRVHGHESPGLKPDPLFFLGVYRTVYLNEDLRSFLESFSRGVLARPMEKLLSAGVRTLGKKVGNKPGPKKNKKGKKSKGTGSSKPKAPKGVGVLLTCYGLNQPVRRCTEPLLLGQVQQGLTGIYPDGDVAAAEAALGAPWNGENVRLIAGHAERDQTALTDLAARVKLKYLDFLFYPEVGLSNTSRWLSSQRLARVQATTYGHPSTTGAAAMDYFVGGAVVEDGERQYSERLILLPGLGVASTEPPAVEVRRARPVDDPACRFVSLSSYDKIHGRLLTDWDGILDGGGSGSRLDMYCGMSKEESRQLTELGRANMRHGSCFLVQPILARKALLAELAEADVALDSYPFSGFNSLVDALSMSLPVVTLDRPGAAGRFGSAVIRALGLQEHLVASDRTQYVELARRLASDPILRRDLRDQLSRERVLAALCDPNASAHFDAAVQWMREQGPNNPGPPVYIEAGEPVRVLEPGDPRLALR